MNTKSYFSISYARGLGAGGLVGPFRFGASQISVSRGSLRGGGLCVVFLALVGFVVFVAFGTVAYMWLFRFDGMMQAKAPVKKAAPAKKALAVKKTAATKKTAAKKTTATKKTAAKKTPAKKAPAKKSSKK